VQLTVVAPVHTLTGGDEPGEVDGQPIPAALVRELAYSLGLLPRPETPAQPAAEPAEEPNAEPVDQPADGPNAEPTEPAAPSISVNERAAADLAALLNLRSAAGTALAHLPTIAVTDEISGQLLALTNGAELRRTAEAGHCLGPPPDTDRYSPATALARFVRARDRRCRFPGCRTPAHRCDLDHNTPWPTGPTSETNLCCLCRHHHRLSHQAPGWTMHRLPDGGLRWTTPGGDTITTYPIGYGTDDDFERPPRPETPAATDAPAAPPQPLSIVEQLRRWPPPPPNPDDEPPPF
jgi:hypothetical protein